VSIKKLKGTDIITTYIFPSDISSERQESDCEEHWPIDLPVYSGINKPKRCYRIFSSLDQWSENDEMKDDNNTDDKNVRCPLLLQKHIDNNVPEGYFLRKKWNFSQLYGREWDENDEGEEEEEKETLHKVSGHVSQLNNKIKHKPLLVDTPITDTKSENNHLFTDKLQKPLGSSNDSYGNNYNIDKNEQCNDKTEIDKNENCNKEMYSNMPEGYYLKMRFGDFGYRHRCGYGTDDEDG